MHSPVMLTETIEALQPRAGGRYLDVTLGGGGHASAILEASAPDGALLGADADAEAIARCQLRLAVFGARALLKQAWLDEAIGLAERHGFTPLDGIVADLGLSSFQLDEAARGFAFMREGPLDMRFDSTRGEPVSAWLDRADAETLTRALRDYGEVDGARRVAEAILDARPLRTTTELRDVVAGAVKGRPNKRIHPATQVFQALRIVANDELNRLRRALPMFIGALAAGGRLAVITFHSLEDRIVKDVFRDESKAALAQAGFGAHQPDRPARVRLLSKKPATPTDSEVRANPRARSAKLRVVEKL